MALLVVSFLAPMVFGSFQPFALFGMIVSWLYLRFYQKVPLKPYLTVCCTRIALMISFTVQRGTTVGDHSAEFAFSTLFPELLQYGLLESGRGRSSKRGRRSRNYDSSLAEAALSLWNQ